MKLSIAIIDVLGLTYDGNTLETRGLGGSESAIIYMSKELIKLGFDVTVYNSCIDSQAKPGLYDGVKFVDLTEYIPAHDIMISSRSIRPFIENKFKDLVKNAKHRILWMHDTFSDGDDKVEELVVNGTISEIFTLSDFHTTYISTCTHGRRRNAEVLKDKIFMTRNGIKRHIEEVDITKKDKNLFVYNASLTKGLVPLYEKIWPRVKHHIPDAKLKVIGGFYRFRDGAAPDQQETDWQKLVEREKKHKSGVEFLGVIPQQEIAQILAKASFMIYPGAFPETFGISTLEALSYNTPLITTRSGALGETAIDLACYHIDYYIEPNVVYPDINGNDQVDKFVNMVLYAYNTPYLHAQKIQYCNIVHDVSGWDTVALQWKQHFFQKLGHYLPVEEYRQVSKINEKVHTIFGRRFSNQEEWQVPRTDPQQKIVVITPFYNAEQYIEQCIRSIAAQDYNRYVVHLIDDHSRDKSYEIAKTTIESLPFDVRQHFELKKSLHYNRGAVENAVNCVRQYSSKELDELIIMQIDGDDSLVNNPNIFHFYNNLYHEGVEFTYGSCWSLIDNIPLVAQNYPKAVRDSKTYRQCKWAWGLPYTHLRTWKNKLIRNIPDSAFQDAEGKWFRAGGDTAIFYNLIEQADPDKIRAIPNIVYNYNDANVINDWKVNGEEQTKTAQYVSNQKPYHE